MKRTLVAWGIAWSGAAIAASYAIAACSNFSGSDSGSGGGSDASSADAGDASTSAAADGATSPGADGASALDAGAAQSGDAGGKRGIACNGATCEAGADTCCSLKGSGDYTCEPFAAAPSQCAPGTTFDCDDWADCASQGLVCCGLKTSDGLDYYTSECTTIAGCSTKSPGPAVICAAGSANACPMGAACLVPEGGAIAKAAFCEGLF